MLYVRKLFTQDLRDGKQIAFPKEPSLSFFAFDYLNKEEDRKISFTFRGKFNEFEEYDGKRIETRLYAAGSESRMDGEVKAFIRDILHANVDDLLIMKNKGTKHTDFEFMFVPQSNPMYSTILLLAGGENHSVYSFEKKNTEDKHIVYQQIYYGAPGTGKSNEIKKLTGENGDEGRIFGKNFTFRTTFHPDSDYASFMGAYKPVLDTFKTEPLISQKELDERFHSEVDLNDSESIFKFGEKYWKTVETLSDELKEILIDAESFSEKKKDFLRKGMKQGRERSLNKDTKIVYKFRPQTFLKAYIEAWKNPSENVAIVIEEINRGNCAQIFGDIFQLLDRESNGLSKYPIEADIDLQAYLCEALEKMSDTDKDAIDSYYSLHYDNAFEKIKNGEILALPKNLSLLATMNTSDQSLFPMDSAFKRRWEWVYQPIVKGVDSETKKPLNWTIKIDGYKPVDWWEFLQRINKIISNLTTSEDKQLGYFFCIPDNGDEISAKNFVGKVVFYLWNDVFKDYAFEPDCCKDNTDKKEVVLYDKFYEGDGKSVAINVLVQFLNNLKVNETDIPLAVKESAGENGDDQDGNSTSAKFSIDNGGAMTLGAIAAEIVRSYSESHPESTASQIRDTFNTACDFRVVETEDEFNLRRNQVSAERSVTEVILTNTEKVYVSTQWRAKNETDNFFKFVEVVKNNNWGNITRID